MKALQEANRIRMRVQLTQVFTPSAPVDSVDLFIGRTDQVTRTLNAVAQKGQHVLMFGERGVGKTSLANLIHDFWVEVLKDEHSIISIRINCNTTDDFPTLWSRIAEEIEIAFSKRKIDLPGGAFQQAYFTAREGNADPSTVRRLLDLADRTFILVIDEFDRLQDEGVKHMLAETIKTLSDHAVAATIVLVGVAENVDELIGEHESIDRALVQVMMPRMPVNELEDIVIRGMKKVGMGLDPKVANAIALLSQGLPHYAHLLGLYAGINALSKDRSQVTREDIKGALDHAISNVHESIRSRYREAITSPQETLFKQVILACAMTKGDDLGYFAPGDVAPAMSQIMKEPCQVTRYARHLHQLCGDDKGAVLQQTGTEHKRRFRFSDPFLRPFAMLNAVAEGLLDEQTAYAYLHG